MGIDAPEAMHLPTRIWRLIRRLPYSTINSVTTYLQPAYEKVELSPWDADTDTDHELSNRAEAQSPGDDIYHHQSRTRSRPKKGRGRLQWYILILCATLEVMTEFGEFLSAAPQQEIFLQIVCNAHYASIGDNSWHDTSGETCRIESVQTELALVDGWKETLDQLPGVLLAIPYGILADRVGRKPIMLLGQIGVLISEVFVRIFCWYSNIFSLRWVWVASFWRIIGGGIQVRNAMIFTALADTHDELDRADAFYKLLAAILISEIIAVPLSAGLMMKSSSWLPYALTPVILFATLMVTLLLLPETLPEAIRSPRSPGSPSEAASKTQTTISAIDLNTVASTTRTAVANLAKRRNVVYLLFCFFAATIGRKAMVLLLQFVYKKFGWSFAQASFLLSLRGSVNLFLNLVILPLLTKLLMSPRFPFQLTVSRKDLALSKLAACLLTLGCFTLAICSSVTTLILGVSVFALGNSFFLSARSLVTSLVPPTHVGVLYTTIGMVSGVGVLIAGPALAQAFSLGMRMGDDWLGLPYWVAAVLFGMVAVSVWLVRLPDGGSGTFEIGAAAQADEEEIPMLERVDA